MADGNVSHCLTCSVTTRPFFPSSPFYFRRDCTILLVRSIGLEPTFSPSLLSISFSVAITPRLCLCLFLTTASASDSLAEDSRPRNPVGSCCRHSRRSRQHFYYIALRDKFIDLILTRQPCALRGRRTKDLAGGGIRLDS